MWDVVRDKFVALNAYFNKEEMQKKKKIELSIQFKKSEGRTNSLNNPKKVEETEINETEIKDTNEIIKKVCF